MPRSDFYHLLRFRLEDALPRLLDRVLRANQRAVVLASSPERVEDLTVSLWDHRDLWLPHGSVKDGFAADQPVWLTCEAEDCPNGAQVLVLCDGMDSPLSATLGRTLDLFNGHDPQAVQAARGRWKTRLNSGHELYYWQQDEGGRWAEKARRVSGDDTKRD
jgi:DNA polymerase-3 subunit chi